MQSCVLSKKNNKTTLILKENNIKLGNSKFVFNNNSLKNIAVECTQSRNLE